MYEHLNLKAWPFQTVPDDDFAQVWAGRSQTKTQIDQIVRKMQLIPRSSLRLFWANFGMGKTHTLLHIKHLCKQTEGHLIPVYAVMPNRPSSFLDIYRSIVSALPFEHLSDQLIKVSNTGSGSLALNPMFSKSPGLVNALLAMRAGDLERVIAAQQWLTAQPGLISKDLRKIGVSYRIKTAEDAIHALTALTKLSTFGQKPVSKLVVLLDEYQRIGELKPATRNQINAGLHGYFNENPVNVDITLTFSFGREDNVSYFLSNELKSRAEPETISLDTLSRSEAISFLRDLLAGFRIHDDDRWAYPFSPNAITTLVAFVEQSKSLTPRRLMLYANHVLLEYITNNTLEENSEISAHEVTSILDNPQIGGLDVDE